MKLTVLGCSGSVPVPGNAATGYLVSFDNAPSIVMDLGPGTLAQLQKYQDPNDAHVIFSHLHADHCMDFPSLVIWRRYHGVRPAKSRNLCFGPGYTPHFLGRLVSDDHPDGVDDLSDTFAFSPWRARQRELIDDVYVTPYPVIHPVETYALRLEEPATGRVICFSGDSAYTEELVDAARGADLFLCEAAWGPSSEGKVDGMHMSGAEAGRIAQAAGVKQLVLVHLQPWGDARATVAAARAEFDGEVTVAAQDMQFEL